MGAVNEIEEIVRTPHLSGVIIGPNDLAASLWVIFQKEHPTVLEAIQKVKSAAQEQGFTAFKVSNPVHYDRGIEGLNKLEEKVAGARETVGADAELMLNPVMAYNVEFATGG